MDKATTKVDERDTYWKAFRTLFNLWREDERIKAFIFSKRLAKIAADLMQVEGVRLSRLIRRCIKKAVVLSPPWTPTSLLAVANR